MSIQIPHSALLLNLPLHSLSHLPENIWQIVVTGGPCGGKSTGMSYIRQNLIDRGYVVLVVPEVATKLFAGGLKIGEAGLDAVTAQYFILRDILMQETSFLDIAIEYAKRGQKVVILCDRGTMDGEAYVPSVPNYDAIITSLGAGFNPRMISVERYHAVLHLRSAAIGAPQFYTCENNVARTETLEQAASIDERTLAAWHRSNHPHLRVINNSGGTFASKLHRLFLEICAVLGEPTPLEKERAFLIDSFEVKDIPSLVSVSEITQYYLLTANPKDERRIRMRGDEKNGYTYYSTIKQHVSDGIRAEMERMISAQQFEVLLTMRDPAYGLIKKRRHCFFYRDRFFEADQFIDPSGLSDRLEVEVTDLDEPIEMPPFLKIKEEVTGNKEYSNRSLAKILA